MSPLYIALIMGLLTAVGNVVGSYLAILPYRPSRKFTAAALGFSGGFVLAAALLEMVPESLERGPFMPALIAVGYLLVFMMEQLFNVHLHHVPEEGDHSVIPSATGIASLVAFNTHDFIDGLAIGASMVADTGLGVMVSLAVLFHEVPAGFVIATIMRGAGWSRGAAVMAGASLGFITLVGIGLPFWAWKVSPFLSDALLALAAGSFVYLGATLLVPLSEAARSRWITLMVFLGFAVFLASAWLVELLLG